MKKVLPVLLGLAVGCAAGYFWAAGKKEAVYKEIIVASESNWQAEKAQLEQELMAARNKPPKIQTIYKELPAGLTNQLSPQQILERLIELKPNPDESRNRTFRKIIFYMQSLVEAEGYGLAVIADFLGQNLDVDYSQFDVTPAGERYRSSRGGFLSRNMVRTDFLVPPSLRMGLLDALGQIGGTEAEQVLAETLMTTARGVEVAYLTRMLHDMRPDHYRDMALQAARELLANPPEFPNPNKLDENAKAYLYGVLSMYHDNSFAETAQGLIVDANGRVDRDALRYVNGVLKEYAVPAILEAYNNPLLTSERDRSSLLNVALDYTGPNAQANQMFFQMVTNNTIPAGIRAYSVSSLSGNSQHDPPADPLVIQTRIEFLESIRSTVSNDRVRRALDSAKQNLEKRLTGEVPPRS